MFENLRHLSLRNAELAAQQHAASVLPTPRMRLQWLQQATAEMQVPKTGKAAPV
jgi:hypothetical protein